MFGRATERRNVYVTFYRPDISIEMIELALNRKFMKKKNVDIHFVLVCYQLFGISTAMSSAETLTIIR